tara:strand:- start:2030 stop:2614 length:585 start_codon:yes stop_codon:yes gene_type:complete
MRILRKVSDSELMDSLRQGEITAFDELYHRYAKKAMAFALSFFSNRDLAEEAVQIIFIRIWEKRKDLDSSKSFKSYLFQSIKFYMYNYIRDRKLSCRIEEAPKESFLENPTIEDEMMYSDLVATTHILINSLPNIQQRVFRLNKLDGLTSTEISVVMNLSKRTIEHHIYLATKKIKTSLLQQILIYTISFFQLF